MTKLSPNNRLQTLAEQRACLVERIGQQRVALQVEWTPLERAAGTADRALAVLGRARRFVQAHRATFTLALALTGVALVLARPGRSFLLLKRGIVLWRGWRFVQSAQTVVPGAWLGIGLGLVRRWFTTTKE